MKIVIALLLLALSCSTLGAELSAEQVDDRIVFVGKLVTASSAAKQVDASGDTEAIRLKSDAKKHYEAAISARDAGDLQAASGALSSAVDAIYAAVDAAKKGGAADKDQQRHFDNRRASTKALMSAHEMIAAEKGLQSQHSKLLVTVERQLAQADELQSGGQRTRAWEELNEAYAAVRSAVEGLRRGETLVRELKFENEEEEFRYELDRNDTHEMLVELLLRDRPRHEAGSEQNLKFRQSAAEYRRKAEALANKGQYREAIKALEQSTAELVRTIRRAGVYIPG